jgi:transposase-like protein
VPVGLRLGDTENSVVVTALLADIVDRGLDYTGGLLVVIDGAKALRTAVTSVFGDLALVQRCTLHYPEQRIMPTWGVGALRDGGLVLSGSA